MVVGPRPPPVSLFQLQLPALATTPAGARHHFPTEAVAWRARRSDEAPAQGWSTPEFNAGDTRLTLDSATVAAPHAAPLAPARAP